MSSKSIDGLQRRSESQASTAKKVVPKKKSPAKKIAVSAPKKKRSLEVPEKKKDLKELIAENEALEVEQAEAEKEAHRADVVKDFLEEVRDVDPTDLAEVPKKEQKKEKRKKMKAGDRFLLYDAENPDQSIICEVLNMHVAPDFESLFKNLDIKRSGFQNLDELIDVVTKFVSREELQREQVVGIEIKRIR